MTALICCTCPLLPAVLPLMAMTAFWPGSSCVMLLKVVPSVLDAGGELDWNVNPGGYRTLIETLLMGDVSEFVTVSWYTVSVAVETCAGALICSETFGGVTAPGLWKITTSTAAITASDTTMA